MEKKKEELNIGVLDIYGFEIFQVTEKEFLHIDSVTMTWCNLLLFRKMVLNSFVSTLSMRNCSRYLFS